MKAQIVENRTVRANLGFDKKIEDAKKILDNAGLTGAFLKEAYKNGKTPVDVLREHALCNNKKNGKPPKKAEQDPVFNAIIDEWCAQAETIEVLNKKIKRLQNKVKKQQARIKELEMK
ncbi:MAG TPA: hypothetical protein ENJ95_21605 [Bacteroidetes bacterium]|nr:hypothetical protein [Bacteroidota bacterium]